jgi:hypothetical protein
MMKSKSFTVFVLVLFGCNEIVEPIVVEPQPPPALAVSEKALEQREINFQLSALPSFSDEEGSGYFIDLAGRVVRLRADGTKATIESHPANMVLPGEATGLWAVGAHSALVATTRGLFVASDGWLIEPTFRNEISAATISQVALATDGSTWISDSKRLLHLVQGQLQELKEAGASIANVTALAVGETPDAPQGVWFAREGKVSFASQLSATAFQIASPALTKSTLTGGVTHLASIAETRNTSAEVWLATPTKLIRFRQNKFDIFSIERSVKQLISAGQRLFMQTGDALYSYAPNKEGTISFSKSTVPALSVFASNPSGEVWARVGAKNVVLSPNKIRVFGLFENEELFDGLVPLEVSLERNAVEPMIANADAGIADAGIPPQFEWRIDEEAFKKAPPSPERIGTGLLQSQRVSALNGRDIFGAAKTVVLSALTPGNHVIEIKSGTSARQLNFRYAPFGAKDVSYAQEIAPISSAKCLMCHGEGTSRPLATYEQWQSNSARIVYQVKQGLMPPGSALDASKVALISRWVSGGQKP